ncbi:MerR family transcriptional regulator [Streptomyces sp. NPDC029674]|uniref:MerR family transcriptional regulator n=1 Tax=Streptomyces sp. NPDC029674 TaxID=3365297 RepID=UPI0038515AF3
MPEKGLLVAWSTRQLAELAGTTAKTVRHYHEIGLLDEPERASNGYKRYGISHLVRLLRIRRLTDLGVALADVPSVESGDEAARQILRDLDAELAADIERRQRMRRELAAVMENRAALDMPPDFRTLADNLPETQRSLLLAYSSILTPAAMAAIREQLSAPRGDLEAEFAALDEDAPDEVRQRLAERLAPDVRQQHRDPPAWPTWAPPRAGKRRSPSRSSRTPWSSSTTAPTSTCCNASTRSSSRTTPRRVKAMTRGDEPACRGPRPTRADGRRTVRTGRGPARVLFPAVPECCRCRPGRRVAGLRTPARRPVVRRGPICSATAGAAARTDRCPTPPGSPRCTTGGASSRRPTCCRRSPATSTTAVRSRISSRRSSCRRPRGGTVRPRNRFRRRSCRRTHPGP